MHPLLVSVGLGVALWAAQSASSPASPTAQAPATAAAAAQPLVGDEDSGHDIYSSSCRACHAGAIAPTLKGVVGRPIASVADYAGYSAALKAKSATTWTPENLDTFITAPQAFAPGTKMQKSLPDAQQRADLIAYLKSLSAAE